MEMSLRWAKLHRRVGPPAKPERAVRHRAGRHVRDLRDESRRRPERNSDLPGIAIGGLSVASPGDAARILSHVGPTCRP